MLVSVSGVVRADDLADVQRLFRAGQTPAAIERADRYLTDHPKDPQMRFVKGVMLAEDPQKIAEAIALFEALIADYPDLAEPYNNVAALYAAQGDYAKARAALDQALRINPAYATAHENLGDVYAALAAKSYERALTLQPDAAALTTKLARVRELYKQPAGRATPTLAPASAAPVPR